MALGSPAPFSLFTLLFLLLALLTTLSVSGTLVEALLVVLALFFWCTLACRLRSSDLAKRLLQISQENGFSPV
ncbi:hypothetical protein BpHYR1_018426 [Brachionus plicatilis]|uniref:Uncharacterized protein n=1 Tax=Brachionus plicatilis TaxID=10195 RepID=A0A3M7PIZ4_BRAPC|nr:hypothetical protein BpHYR1_018426 [Brachionus plicatilis]